jgi:nicotinamidase-related amidase
MAFVKGEWGAEIVDVLAPQEGDVIIEGKRGLGSFATTNLDFILRGRGITTIALGGFLTNCCVESTMRTGYEKGYYVITLSDCVAATSAEDYQNAIQVRLPDVLRGDDWGSVHGATAGRAGQRAVNGRLDGLYWLHGVGLSLQARGEAVDPA